MSGLEIDFETRSLVDLRKRGAYNYFADPSTEPLMASYAIDGGPVRRWRPPAPCPVDIRAHVEAGGMVSAHNAAFERGLWQQILTPRYGWPELRLEQCRCTAATAAAMSLPRDLAGLGTALGLAVQKDKEGSALIRHFSIPKRSGGFNEPADFPEKFERFHDYCDQDVRAEAAADRRMVPLSAHERDLWLLDQRINDRGVRIDRTSAIAALRLAEKAKRQLDQDMTLATDGAVTACSQVARLTAWIQAQGVELGSAGKAELEDVLQDDIPPNVRRAIELRLEAAKASVSKLSAMLDRASADGRVRGWSLFCGAGTGRWSAVGLQVHNLPRPRRSYEDAKLDTAALFEAFRSEEPELLRTFYGPELGRPLHLISDAVRGFIWSAPGHDLVQADYSGIEGAVAAWFAGETWKLDALFGIMADPLLPDLYRRTAAGIMNTTTDVITRKHPFRQSLGKVSELALNYAGGVSAFHSMSRAYSVDLEPLFGPVWETASPERQTKAEKRYERCLRRGESKADVLSRNAWIACELIKVGWRATNPAIAASWDLLEEAMRAAITEPGRVAPVLRCSYLVAQGFLWCRLPSGRCLAYGAPRLRDQVWVRVEEPDGSWSDDSEIMPRDVAEHRAAKGEVQIERSAKRSISALGVNSQTKRWERFGLYGGLAFENIVQAIARDLLANGMRKAEAAGYPVVLHVHDEIVTEVPHGFGDLATFEKLICELPPWAEGLPLTASGWRGKRYRKD